jgi:asparagine synthase (glutamine-hydrolysing)
MDKKFDLTMCGIAGAIDVAADRATAHVKLLNKAQSHRGPDHSIVVTVGVFTLGNTRLAIQSPGPSGNQPFVSGDGRYHCVFNGEIYNHRSLVERYALAVNTSCDGEIIPELWAKLGIASLAELRGMFAIALVDSLEQRLYLIRDPFGIKPLYWRKLPQGLIFASEVRPLAEGARVDAAAIARCLHLGAVAADRSPFLEIMAVPTNSVAIFDRDGHASVQPILPGGPLAIVGGSNLETALTDSVELHLGADVPTALLLSAGIDSATIAAASRRLGRDLDCLTVAADGAADESDAAAKTARHYGHRFQRVPAVLEEGDVARFFHAMQRPTIDGLNTYVVSKAVHEAGFKVALSGLGGDEAVGGYSHFRLLKYLPALRLLDRMPKAANSPVSNLIARMGHASSAKSRKLIAFGGPREAWGLSLLQREVLPGPLVTDLTGIDSDPLADSPDLRSVLSPRAFSTMVAAEVAMYLQAMLLPDADGFSMASSVELRVPFVDSHVFSASLRLAEGKSTPPGKDAVGMALHDSYLRSLAIQPKRGFSVPMRRWMMGPLASVLRAANDPEAAVWSVVDRKIADRAGLLPLRPGQRWSEAWALAVVNAWLETH